MDSKFYKNTVLVTGFAELPKGTALKDKYSKAGVVLVIEKSSSEIKDASFTVITDITNNYLKEIVVGYRFSDGVDKLIEEIYNRVKIPSVSAFCQALKSCYDKYYDSF
ncbi:DUF3870 domain-containing protein [Natranaerofaba carboxydovora]|uniref:DUF3870 domain-containing protein n=1 Tax=Natranaerofaba carboxydovora TaxID=2742683 RepID=UPI001F130C07|nr:DUF3870 domain-containing protein [Natranaerofaba carboxydovora]UMZ74307.1 hypothetical protein ACONDI_01894 [Natranaerofaba carboxydovora]